MPFFVVHNEDRAIFELDRGRIGTDCGINLIRAEPCAGFVTAYVECCVREAMREEDFAGAEPGEMRAMARETDVTDGSPRQSEVKACCEMHVGFVAAQGCVENAIFEEDQVCFGVQSHAAVFADGNWTAPSSAFVC